MAVCSLCLAWTPGKIAERMCLSALTITRSIKGIMEKTINNRDDFLKVISIGLSILGIVEPPEHKVVYSNTMGWENIQQLTFSPIG